MMCMGHCDIMEKNKYICTNGKLENGFMYFSPRIQNINHDLNRLSLHIDPLSYFSEKVIEEIFIHI